MTKKKSSKRIGNELDKLINRIKILLEDNYSVAEISKMIGYGYSGVYNAIQRHGMNDLVSVKNTSRTARSYLDSKLRFTKEQLIDEYVQQKNNLYEIAKKYNMTPSNVFLYMKKYGIKRRNKSEANVILYQRRGEELREKHRQNGYNGISGIHRKGRKSKETNIEKIFEKYCIDNNFLYQKQFQINSMGHHYDFLVNNTIIVEIDGNYWHNTEKQKKLDERHSNLAKAAGYAIIRFTDTEIKQTKGKCFDELKSYDNRRTSCL